MLEDSMAIEPTQRAITQGSSLRSVVSKLIGSKEPPLAPQAAMGFFTDTSLCIGCKACEIACKQWNQLPASDPVWTGSSYDNTGQLSATTWRHVQFIEHIGRRDMADNWVGGDRSGASPAPTIYEQAHEREYSRGDPRGRTDIPFTAPGKALPFFSSDRWLMQSDVCK